MNCKSEVEIRRSTGPPQTSWTANGWSEAAWEHKAFNYFPERKLLAIPFSDYLPSNNGNYWDNFVSDVRVFGVDLQTGITPKGSLSDSWAARVSTFDST